MNEQFNEQVNEQNNNAMSTVFNFFENMNISNDNNNRFIIIGESGSGKTTLAFTLMYSYLPKYVEHTYIIGGKNKLAERNIKLFNSGNIQTTVYDIENKKVTTTRFVEENKELKLKSIITDFNGFPDLTKIRKHSLLFIDDVSHCIQDNSLNKFLNQSFTTSRQQEYDIIAILHKVKLGNTLMRKNATKLFFTSYNDEIAKEFPEINNTGSFPIIYNLKNKKQEILDFSEFSKNNKVLNAEKFLKRISLINPKSVPKFARSNNTSNGKFLIIDEFFDKDGNSQREYQIKIPKQLLGLIEKSKMLRGIIFDDLLRARNQVIQGEQLAVSEQKQPSLNKSKPIITQGQNIPQQKILQEPYIKRGLRQKIDSDSD